MIDIRVMSQSHPMIPGYEDLIETFAVNEIPRLKDKIQVAGKQYLVKERIVLLGESPQTCQLNVTPLEEI